jgi:hypothetical protein
LYRATACHACTSHRVHHCPSYSAECHCRSACCRADCPSQSTDSLLSSIAFSPASHALAGSCSSQPASQPLHSPTTVLRPCLVINTPDSSWACSRAGCSCSSSSLPASSTVHKSAPWMWPLPHPPAQRQPRLELDFLTRCMHDLPPARHSGAAPRAVHACPLPYLPSPLRASVSALSSPLSAFMCALPCPLSAFVSALSSPLSACMCALPSSLSACICPLPCPLSASLCALHSSLRARASVCALSSSLSASVCALLSPLSACICPLPCPLSASVCALPCPLSASVGALHSSLHASVCALFCPLSAFMCALPCPLSAFVCALHSVL